MMDCKVKVMTRTMELYLYKRGLDKLEKTKDHYGVSLLDKLIHIIDNSDFMKGSLNDIETISDEAREIVDIYVSVYFPNAIDPA
mgnify:CR=1 FL=1